MIVVEINVRVFLQQFAYKIFIITDDSCICLLYTSDAADE